MRTTTCPRSAEASPSLGAAICLETFLRTEKHFSHQMAVRLRSSFGRAVRRAWDEKHHGLEPPKKHVFVNGQEQSVNSYYETHRHIVEAAFEHWKHKGAATRAGGGPLSRISDFFARQAGCSNSGDAVASDTDADTA